MKPKFNKAKFLEERNQPIRSDVYATVEDIKRHDEFMFNYSQMKKLIKTNETSEE